MSCIRNWNLQSTNEEGHKQDYLFSQRHLKPHNLSKRKTKNGNIDEELPKAHDEIEGVKIDTMWHNLWLPKAGESNTQCHRNPPQEANDAQRERPMLD